MKHISGARSAALLLATILAFSTGSATTTTAVRDNAPNCDCFLLSGTDRGYFQNHRFIDFRNIPPGPGEDFTKPPPLLVESENAGAEAVTSSYFNSTPFTTDWFFTNGPTKHNSTLTSVDSPRNIFLFKDPDTESTYLALRAQRLASFVSNAEIDTNLQTILHSSLRTRARLIPALSSTQTSGGPQPYTNPSPSSPPIPGLNTSHPIAPGAVLGFFTYHSETQESDIEILTSDPVSQIRYSNQPDYNIAADTPVAGASTAQILARGIDWTNWHEHRIDWFAGVSRWYVDGTLVLEKTVNVPTAPSALLLNLWSDGGNWSGDMSVGAQVVAGFEWVEMVYNVSDAGGGAKGCGTGCVVDGVRVQGTPEKGFGSGAARGMVVLQMVFVGVVCGWLGVGYV